LMLAIEWRPWYRDVADNAACLCTVLAAIPGNDTKVVRYVLFFCY
jgi:hypothetical protein